MDIRIEKVTTNDGALVFTIRCDSPKQMVFTDQEAKLMKMLEDFKDDIDKTLSDVPLRIDLIELCQNQKMIVFDEIMNYLTSSIDLKLKPKFNSINKEIFNWFLSYQSEPLKKWIAEFRPFKENFYFDNPKDQEI